MHKAQIRQSKTKPTTTKKATTKTQKKRVQTKIQNKKPQSLNKSPTVTKQQSFTTCPSQFVDTPIQYKFVNSKRNVSLLGVPFAFGQPLQGVDRAPQEMRQGGLLERISAEKWSITDHGDIPVVKVEDFGDETRTPDGTFKIKSGPIVSRVCHDTAIQTAKHTAEGDFMLTLGGDHSIALGSIAGILKSRPNTGIIWVDAHADINTPFTTQSGNVHGMPVAFLMKHPQCNDVASFEWLKEYPKLDPTQIVYIGLRDLDVGEKNTIKQYGIKAFTMQDVDRYGIGTIMDKAIRHLTNDRRLDCPIHLSVDIDGVDPLFAPSTGTRVFGGLSYREAYFICEAAAETGLLASMDLVEVNPSLGESPEAAARTVKIANGLIAAALGNRIL